MEVFNFKIDGLAYEQKIKIIPIGDTHLGTKNAEIGKLKALINWIKNEKDTYWIGLGDYGEFINYLDPRFSPRDIVDELKDHLDDMARWQAKLVIDTFMPIRDKCIGLADGNHEAAIKKHCNYDVYADICNNLRVKALGYMGFVNLAFQKKCSGGRSMVRILYTHGYGGGREVGNKLNKIKKLSKDFDADIYMMGHVHEKGVHNCDVITSGITNNIIRKTRAFCLTGTFYNPYHKGTTSYAEKMAFSPGDIGVVKVIITPFRIEPHVNGKRVNLPPDIHASE